MTLRTIILALQLGLDIFSKCFSVWRRSRLTDKLAGRSNVLNNPDMTEADRPKRRIEDPLSHQLGQTKVQTGAVRYLGYLD